MKRKWLVLFSLVLIASLLTMGITPVQAGRSDQWTQIPLPAEVIITPGPTALEVFNWKLYASFMDFERGTSIWRMDEDGSWTQASEFGFGTPELSAVPDMVVFNGMLYATAMDWMRRLPAAQLWRSPDGINWEAVTTDGFNQPGESSFSLFAVFNKMLYVAGGSSAGMQIWRSASGAPGTWRRVDNHGLGDTPGSDTTALIVFNGALYAIIGNPSLPASVWRSNEGTNWSMVTNDGFGDPLNIDPGGAAVFQDYLYLGMTHLDRSSVVPGNPAKYPKPAQIWRTKDGRHWERVMKGGFGDWHNIKVDSLYTFDDRLYAGTVCYDWVNNVDEEGVQIWSSADGLHWTQVNSNGFGDKYNWVTHLSVDVTAYRGSLYYGTWNDQDRGQIWKLNR